MLLLGWAAAFSFYVNIVIYLRLLHCLTVLGTNRRIFCLMVLSLSLDCISLFWSPSVSWSLNCNFSDFNTNFIWLSQKRKINHSIEHYTSMYRFWLRYHYRIQGLDIIKKYDVGEQSNPGSAFTSYKQSKLYES